MSGARQQELETTNIGRDFEINEFFSLHDGILCFGGEDWWYHNRAHFDMQVMQCMARKLPVLFINSVGFRMPSVKEGTQFFHRIGRKLRSVVRPISNPFADFYVASPFSVPLWHRPFIANLNSLSLDVQIRKACRSIGLRNPLLWVACPPAFEVVKRMQGESFLVYQRTDKYEEYSQQSREYIMAADRWLSQHADLVLYVSRALYKKEREGNPRSLLVRHGVDLALFDPVKASEAGKPPELANIRRPIVGFLGEIEDDTTDMALVGAAARALPEVSFVFVGRLIADPSPLRGLTNIHFVGKKPYEEVPRYGMQFDVAILPWKRNWWAHYSNPIKLMDYLALGLPVVSTEFLEALYYQDVIYVARSENDFIQGIRDALDGRGVGNVESRRARVVGATWEQVALHIAQIIRKFTVQSSNGKRIIEDR
jgi:glycosyltransferase involved in cell wall biosynthesis